MAGWAGPAEPGSGWWVCSDDHGRHIVDFGQNLPGWLRLGTDAPPGARVRIWHGEVLTPDGARTASVAGHPGAPGAQEAVFTVGSGSHEFAGPALTSYGRQVVVRT
jgi:hypothetical protein